MEHDYRATIRAWTSASEPGHSLRALARACGTSPSMLSRVLSGTRGLDPDRASAVADAMGLDEEQREVFVAQVTVWHGRSETSRVAALRFLDRHAQLQAAVELPDGAESLEWPGIAVLEAVMAATGTVESAATDPEGVLADLHTRLDPPSTAADVRAARDALVAVGLLGWENGRLVAAVGTWFARLRDDARHAVFHGLVRDALDRARRAHALHPADERAGGVVTLTIEPQDLAVLKSRCEQFLADIATLRTEDGRGEVCEIVVHAHRLTRAAAFDSTDQDPS